MRQKQLENSIKTTEEGQEIFDSKERYKETFIEGYISFNDDRGRKRLIRLVGKEQDSGKEETE